MTFVRRLALVVLPVVVLLVLTEGLLWGLGLGERMSQDVSRGFDPRARYLVQDGDGWRTQVFDDPSREVRVAPRSEAVRVVLFGGSNTQVFPEQVLRQRLEERAPAGDGRAFEVINLGREGYGSARVGILLDQAMALEPDVVVIYAGHNEFIERSFAEELEQALGEGRGLAGAASRLRLFGLLEDAFTPPVRPEPLARTAPEERPVTLAERDRYYAAYRGNLERMVDRAREAGAAVLVGTLASNLLDPPYVDGLPAHWSEAEAEAFEARRSAAMVLIPREHRMVLRPPVRLRLGSWTGMRGKLAWTDERLPPELRDPARVPPQPRLRPLVGPLAQAPATTGEAASVAGAHWSDPAGWNADVRLVTWAMERLVERRLLPGQRERVGRAVAELEQLVALVPDSPRVLFDLALATWLQGEDDAGCADLLRRAAASDRAPHSANDVINAIVREVVAERPDVALVDVEADFRAASPAGLVGYELLMDGCHIQPGARHVVMDRMAEAILDHPGLPRP